MSVLRINPLSTTFNPHPTVDDRPWWHSCVIYQVYPRSFMDTNADGIGDLPGITQQLPYLRDLGVDCVWLSPFFRSPMADFGYDISDYEDVDPIFGTMQDFDDLLATAHEHGIRVIIDLVPNHTSDQHPWFLESRSSKDNPKRDWYLWRDPKPDGTPPINLVSFFQGDAWTFDETTGQYYLHMFLPQQPDLNWRNPQVVEAMHDMMRFWLDKGIDGFRLDAITVLIKREPLSDLPEEARTATGLDLLKLLSEVHNQPALHTILKGFRRLLDAYDRDTVLIGETNIIDFDELNGFYGDAHDEIHLPMNLETLTLPWDAAGMQQSLAAYYEALKPGNVPSIVLGNHDRSRFATRYGPENHRTANMLLLTLWGVPTMYYGDELGMLDGRILPEHRQDPFVGEHDNVGSGRDPERTPMQWDDGPNAGFTGAGVQPWLPVATTFVSNVEEQAADANSTLNFCKRLLTLRHEHTALQWGSIQFMAGTDHDLLIYERAVGDERLLIVLNFGGKGQVLDLSAVAPQAEVVLCSINSVAGSLDVTAVSVQPHEGLILRVA